ncbi:MAG: LrgB family protein [Thalassotalea sp.]
MNTQLSYIFTVLLTCSVTVLIYQGFARVQVKLNRVWLNPMLLTVLVLIACLSILNIDYAAYKKASSPLNTLLELAVVTLGFPLYQYLQSMKTKWQAISVLLVFAALVAIVSSFILTWLFISQHDVAISLSLKSITTPIALAITEQFKGNAAVTAFTIILAGLFGAIWGVKWLTFIGVTSVNAQGLAIGTASHALGTATVSQLSYQHAAYSSLALILSATITAIVAPVVLPFLLINFG